MSSEPVARFKEVVGHFVTGVVVVSARSATGPVGFTCQTFGSLSLDPMLVTFAASIEGKTWPLVRDAPAVGINILSSQQESLARVFATTGIDKFEGVHWEAGPQGAPLLEGALAHLEGKVVATTRHGDHDVAVVQVDFVDAHSGAPLVFYRGAFDVLE